MFCGIVGSVVLENYGWRITFQMIGVLCLLWVYYYKNYVLIKSRAKLNMLNAKDALLDDGSSNSSSNPSTPATSASPNTSASVPWVELLTKPSFWALIVAHVCQNNAYYILLTWFPTYFQENYPGSKGWIFNVVPWLISMPSTIFAGWMADKLITQSKHK